MLATYEQASFPYAGLLGLLLAVACILFVVISSVRLRRAIQRGETPAKLHFQRIWSVGVVICSCLLLLVSFNSLSVSYRLSAALKNGAYETWTGTITDIEVEDKGTDFQSKAIYKITVTIDDARQFTCTWLTAEQILLLQKGTTVTIGCASQIGSIMVKDGLTIYQSPDASGNTVLWEVAES